ncbi:MAG: UDP-N-acetylglucosamine 2-epimerase (non-hydrolyzing) [Chloroflexi bacterium]|nr:MAG: UDP-N-acetylglucosamine 2-epimerase (non-hydrolyzing) [Chloroflexota bacterium]
MIAVFASTRPEIIKMAPVVFELKRRGLKHILISTGQHCSLASQAFQVFGLRPDYDLDLMLPNQEPEAFFVRAVERIRDLLRELRPDYVLVQGDTISAFTAAWVAFLLRIPIGHVEAGYRSRDLRHPWPEEACRACIDEIASDLFAPTPWAYANLEDLPGRRYLTGNTIVDALHWILERYKPQPKQELYVLVTLHRREAHGEPLRKMLGAIVQLAKEIPLVLIRHPNPNVSRAMDEITTETNVEVVEPLPYPEFVGLLKEAKLVLTDSGGVVEEATALGVPTLILRERTERHEAVATGHAKLVGWDPGRIVGAAREALARDWRPDPSEVYGDGRAARRIVSTLSLGLK